MTTPTTGGKRSVTLEPRATIATARGLIIDMVESKGQGHPGTALSLAPLFYVLYAEELVYDPEDPEWWNRDRLVLSSGHAAAVLYAYLHLATADLPSADLASYRSLGSRTPGHPEHGRTNGVDATTGALGQGLGNAVGMALAEAQMRDQFGSTVVNHRTFVVVGDGDLQEGVSHEVASLAGLWRLDHLVCVYNSNDVTLDGPASRTSADDVAARFRAYGWHIEVLSDGEDLEQIRAALSAAREVVGKPTLVVMTTVIGTPAATLTGDPKVHGSPLGTEEAAATKAVMGLDPARNFQVPWEVFVAAAVWSRRSMQVRALWDRAVDSDVGARLRTWLRESDRPAQAVLDAALAAGLSAMPDVVSPRTASQHIVDELARALPWLSLGAADLARATGTLVEATATSGVPAVAYGIREHGMAAVLTGMAYHGGVRPVGGTYLAFSDYLRPALRLACLSRQRMILVLSHDGFDGAEDGPTHHAVEHVAALRTMPGLTVLRPADAHETAQAWRRALTCHGPVALVLSREPAPVLTQTVDAQRGAYVLESDHDVGVCLVGTGFEVHLAREAAVQLRALGHRVRVVSVPDERLFREQSDDYRQSVLPAGAAKFVLEIGPEDGLRRIGMPVTTTEVGGESGTAQELRSLAGVNVTGVVARVSAALRRNVHPPAQLAAVPAHGRE